MNVETLRTREERRREVFLVLTFGAVFSLIIWTVFLGQDLPGHYNADHWDIVWVGLDCAEAGGVLDELQAGADGVGSSGIAAHVE